RRSRRKRLNSEQPKPRPPSAAALASRAPALRLLQRGIKLDRLLPIRLGPCVVALLGVDPTSRKIRIGASRAEADRLPEVRQRPIITPRPGVGHAPMI